MHPIRLALKISSLEWISVRIAMIQFKNNSGEKWKNSIETTFPPVILHSIFSNPPMQDKRKRLKGVSPKSELSKEKRSRRCGGGIGKIKTEDGLIVPLFTAPFGGEVM
ncbi:MAG TPA: hypothetical protein VHT73_14770 [Thermodesulfobacteriota bacterium]|nr:hypothetical protein [Thermodesulfobacteriota bacterium]